MLDYFGECLAGNMHAAVDAIAGRFPGGDSAIQERDVLIAECGHPFCGARRQPFTVIAPDNARAAPRHQIVDQQFQPAERHARRHQQMPPPNGSFLTRVEQSDLAAIVKLGLQCSCIDAVGLVAWHVLDLSHRTTATALPDRRMAQLPGIRPP